VSSFGRDDVFVVGLKRKAKADPYGMTTKEPATAEATARAIATATGRSQ
jgi:hypothetical protein